MVAKNQQVRASQFVLSYGPGSILETPSGPVVVPSMERLMISLARDPGDFEITEQRLSANALGGARISRVPTNDELNVPTIRFVFPTTRFPMWALCTEHGSHQVLYDVGTGCRECDWMEDWKRKQKAGREAIRFVRACDRGHLDDVDWRAAVHRSAGCTGDQFLWEGAGRSLRQSWLTCTRCNTRVNFGQIYARPHRCSGRRAEVTGLYEPCERPAKVIQRGASHLHVPAHETALTLGEMPLWLHQVLGDVTVRTRVEFLIEDDNLTEDEFRRRIVDNDKVPLTPGSRERLRNATWSEIRNAILHLVGDGAAAGGSQAQVDLREEEFQFLRRAAEAGVPAVPSAAAGSPPLIEVHLADVRRIDPPVSQLGVRVTPVSRLRVVIAQTGYQRLGGAPNSVEFEHGASRWFPGVELFGEGIFIDLPERSVPLSGPRIHAWRNVSDDRCPTDPVFVWWHTLSHRLLRALSIDSGYSSAAIRERVYLKTSEGGESEGGLLLYTTQPGGDGTLGGLIEMAKRFEEILLSAVEDIDTCSNDPLCEESPLHNSTGAVCYSCLLASETSCEWQNRGLDRIVLREHLP